MATKKPKTNVKRSTSSRSVRVTKKKRGISKFQALALVGVLALIGVVAVVASKASGTPPYQYSWNKYCIAAHGSSTDKEIKDCKNKSAEAMVFRLYNGLFGRNPDAGEYKFWTQKFAGDRMKVGTSDLVVRHSAKLGNSDTAFVKAVYRNMLHREATDKEMVAWRTKIKQKKITKAQMMVQFAVSNEAITRNQASTESREGFDAYIARVPKLDVEQTAAKAQKARFDAMLVTYQQPTSADVRVVEGDVASAQNQLTAAGATASKQTITTNDLNLIKENQAKAQESFSHAKARAAVARDRAAEAKRMYDRAEELANFATDIRDFKEYGITKIRARYNATKGNAADATAKANGIQNKINDIVDKYNTAANKYEAEIKRQEAEAARHQSACANQSYSVKIAKGQQVPASVRGNGVATHSVDGFYDRVFTVNGTGCKDALSGWYTGRSHYGVKN